MAFDNHHLQNHLVIMIHTNALVFIISAFCLVLVLNGLQIYDYSTTFDTAASRAANVSTSAASRKVTARHSVSLNEDNYCEHLLLYGDFNAKDVWCPVNCSLHQYTPSEARQCMRAISNVGTNTNKTTLSYWGDSHIRSQFVGLRNHLLDEEVDVPRHLRHTGLKYNNTHINTVVDFYWLPMPKGILRQFRRWWKLYSKNKPQLILFGYASHILMYNYVERGLDECLDMYNKSLILLAEELKQLQNESTLFIWKMQDPIHFADAVRNLKYKTANKIPMYINNQIVNEMNSIAERILKPIPSVHIWKSSRKVAERFINYTAHKDGTHVGTKAQYWDVQILLNYLCNKHVQTSSNICCHAKKGPAYILLHRSHNTSTFLYSATICFGLIFLATLLVIKQCLIPMLQKNCDFN